AASRCPPALWEQLKPGGLLVIPCGSSTSQTLQQVTKRPDGQPGIKRLTGCRFVPLIGEGA
ncbi:MAG: protein-L-isoaspartate O-methyltransferase, partial [Planctomycetales bacterium]